MANSSESTEMSREEMWEELKRRGAATAEVRFSGGNDEGGVDEITLFSADGEVLETLEERNIWIYDPISGRQVQREETDTDRLVDAMVKPVYDEYFSFAGDFSVEGIIIFTVATRKAVMTGTEEVLSESRIDHEV